MVGVLEQYDDTLALLEYKVPPLKGIVEMHKKFTEKFKKDKQGEISKSPLLLQQPKSHIENTITKGGFFLNTILF